ncbi:uncharacterized protein FIBRA_03953 [Fibroporia radiculosa]|uniref:thioredoxin-dependent peroxiredoxin n=1 Tax=Fibroporia radiculosa TaxID=599839 RepID=J4HW97_9APHY|nr:uncharacterized protein FIBRA_03953 [Fibroporia radiculosa]CCM01882.1 predicted protein [Fibroporia radiculosa]
MSHPLINQHGPPLSLPDANGETYVMTPGANGVPIALFFYPESEYSNQGPTVVRGKLANSEMPLQELYKRAKVEIVGISKDPVAKQKAFVEKEKLTYPILSDTSGEARKAYQVGKGLMGLTDARVTFFIDSEGMVR